ncbi:MAG: hypothetical protein LC768_01175 [Acidobacteria bacterium]|nr:hypothetical protein [Acidobacteriota bacterium]MCA1636945.1 hypothetical protein [Acidobacteriota bacterium]
MNKTISTSLFCSLFLLFCLNSCNAKQETKAEVQKNNDSAQVLPNQNLITTNGKTKNESIYQNNKPIIKPSKVIEDLLGKKKENPKISAKELSEFGNELIKKDGYNFGFNVCEIAKANNLNEGDFYSETFRPFNYKLENLKGEKITFQIMNKIFGHPCGCVFDIPVTQLSYSEMTVVVGKKQVKLKRPKEFYSEEIELVDKTLKKKIRNWSIPSELLVGEIDNLGISKDGAKIYFHTEVEELDLEISEDGTFKLVTTDNEGKISKGEELKNFPKDPQNDYLGYKRFTNGFIAKFSYPCT